MVKSKKISFEASLENLEELVKDLEAGDISLETLLDKYTQAVLLSKTCLDQLNQTEAAIDKMVQENKGEIQESILNIEGH